MIDGWAIEKMLVYFNFDKWCSFIETPASSPHANVCCISKVWRLRSRKN